MIQLFGGALILFSFIAQGAAPVFKISCAKYAEADETTLMRVGSDEQIGEAAQCFVWSGNKAKGARLLSERIGDGFRVHPLSSLLRRITTTFLKEDHRRRFRRGQSQYKEGKIAEASDIWERILREDGAHIEVWEAYLEALEQQNTISKLWAERSRLYEYFPNSEKGRIFIAEAALKKDALDWVFRLTKPLLDRSDERILSLYTQALFRNGQQEQAILELRRWMIPRRDVGANIYLLLGKFLIPRNESRQEGIRNLQKAADLTSKASSTSPMAQINREAKTLINSTKD